LLAEVELVAFPRDEARAAIQRGLVVAAEKLLRLGGDALVEIDPLGAAAAYREALTVAGAQGSRALALIAALALAKLLRPIVEVVEAHAVLASALEGLVPTPAPECKYATR
jgi:hypothetical protein